MVRRRDAPEGKMVTLMKYRVRITLEYEEVTDVDTYPRAEDVADERRQLLENTMSVIGIIDQDNLTILSYIEEIDDTKERRRLW